MKIGGKQADLEEQRAALDIVEGFPKAPERVGAAIRHLVPNAFSPGALGWTETISRVVKETNPVEHRTSDGELVDVIDEDEPGDTYVMIVPDDVAARRDGERVRVNAKEVRLLLKEMPPRPPKPPIIVPKPDTPNPNAANPNTRSVR